MLKLESILNNGLVRTMLVTGAALIGYACGGSSVTEPTFTPSNNNRPVAERTDEPAPTQTLVIEEPTPIPYPVETPTPSPYPVENPDPATPTIENKVTPVPKATVTPTQRPIPTNRQILEGEILSLPDYAQNEASAMLAEVSLDGITSEEISRVQGIMGNPLFLAVAKNDDLTHKLSIQNYSSLFRELSNSPYADKLMQRVTNADALENVSQAWNYKVRREDAVLFDILGLSPNDARGWQFRWDNGSYHLNSWEAYNKTGDINTIHIMPLDNYGIGEWFNEKVDAEFAMMQLWVPDSMIIYDINQWKYNGLIKQSPFTGLRNNMDVIMGKEKINGLDQYGNLRDRIVSVLDGNTQSYPASKIPIFRNFSDYENAIGYWRRQQWFPFVDKKDGNFVGKEFQQDIEPALNQWKDFEIGVKIPYGVALIDGIQGSANEPDDTKITPIYMKSLGLAGYEMRGRYPEYTGTRGYHQLLGWGTPDSVIQMLDDKTIYAGQMVSLLSAINGAQQDGILNIRGPPKGDIIWRNSNIKN